MNWTVCARSWTDFTAGSGGAPTFVLALLNLPPEAGEDVYLSDEVTTARHEGVPAATRGAGMIDWPIDPQTAKAASVNPVRFKREEPACQFAGYRTLQETWDDRVVRPSTWPRPLCSSPEQIIRFFQDGHYTQGLAMVVSWGGMGRRSKDIYADRKSETIRQIERTLQEAAESILASRSIEASWNMLMGMEGLRWSAVIASKTLHFLCRSLGFEQNPPAAIDGAVIRETLWPAFRNSIVPTQPPDDWKGNSFQSYCRYMTAIITWVNQRNWTTTQMEATIFDALATDPSACIFRDSSRRQ